MRLRVSSLDSIPSDVLSHDAVRVVARAIGFQLVFGTAFAILTGLVPKYGVTALALDAEGVGRIAAGIPIGALLGAPLLVWLLSRHARPTILRLGAGAFAAATALLVPFGRDADALLAISIAQGVTMMLVFNAASALVADVAPPSHLARMVGFHGAANMVGNAVGPALGEAIAEHAGWPTTFAVAAGIGALALLLTAGLSDADAHAPAKGEGAFEAFLTLPFGTLAPIFVAASLVGAVYSALWTFHQPLLLERGGHRVTAYFVGLTAGALVMRLLFGGLPDRMGHARAAFTFLGVYAATALATRALVPATLVLSGLGHGIAHGTFYPALAALAVGDVTRAQRSTTLTAVYAAFHVGAMIGGFALGAVARDFGNVHVFDTAFALSLLGMGVLAHRVRRASA